MMRHIVTTTILALGCLVILGSCSITHYHGIVADNTKENYQHCAPKGEPFDPRNMLPFGIRHEGTMFVIPLNSSVIVKCYSWDELAKDCDDEEYKDYQEYGFTCPSLSDLIMRKRLIGALEELGICKGHAIHSSYEAHASNIRSQCSMIAYSCGPKMD